MAICPLIDTFGIMSSDRVSSDAQKGYLPQINTVRTILPEFNIFELITITMQLFHMQGLICTPILLKKTKKLNCTLIPAPPIQLPGQRHILLH